MRGQFVKFLGLVLATSGSIMVLHHSSPAPFPLAPPISERYGNLPLSFEENRGQAAAGVKFLARGRGYTMLLKSAEAVLTLHSGRSRGAVSIQLVGANHEAAMAGVSPLPGKSNYFLGRTRADWRTDITTYARVECTRVYPGIDMVFYGNQAQLEYDFTIAPGADPRAISFQVTGPAKLDLDRNGDLVLAVADSQIRLRKPVAYQFVNGGRTEIPAEYVWLDAHRIGFYLERYDVSKALVIDPVLSYSTFVGGSNGEIGNAIAVDASGSAYVAGSTSSDNFPLVGPAQTYPGDPANAFVVKLNPQGTALIFATYLGGEFQDEANGVALDSSGNIYVTGLTASSKFPTVGPLQGPPSTGFLAKLNSSGNALLYSVYLGGEGRAVAVDPTGSAYVAGITESTEFPTVNPLQATLHGSRDAFVTKFNPAGSARAYSTYLGGRDFDEAQGIAVDGTGSAYITGSTGSNDFPVSFGVIQPAPRGVVEAFVAKLNPAGSGLAYSTYLGGSESDAANGIAVDASGNAYITGVTVSSDFPTTAGALKRASGGSNDVFVAELNPAGSTLVYSTYLGGSGDEFGNGIAVDRSGNAYVTGVTGPGDFPFTESFVDRGVSGFFVSKILTGGSALAYSIFLGGGGLFPERNAIAVDSLGGVYATGQAMFAESTPTTPNAYQTIFAGQRDAFVMKIDPSNPLPALTSVTPESAGPGSSNLALTLEGSNFIPDSVVRWNGETRPARFISNSRLMAEISTADLTAVGSASLTVLNSAPGGGVSNSRVFLISQPNPIPALSSISPSIGAAGGPDFILTVRGTGFVETSVVRWGERDRSTKFISSSELEASIPAIDIVAARAVSITVFNPRPKGGVSNSLGFSMSGTVMATISSVTPNGAAVGGTSFTLVVDGFGFTAASVLRWNGIDRPTTLTRQNQLQASIPASDIVAPGFAEITIFNPVQRVASNPTLFPIYVGLSTNDIVYDRKTGAIYASVPSRAGIRGNSIVAINPNTGAVGSPLFIGTEPNRLALSDDGQFLYVALDGSGSFRRVDLPSQTAGPEFSLGRSVFSSGPLFARDMKVLPGRPGSIAIVRWANSSPSEAGVAIFDDGVKRTNETPGHTDSDFIEFSPNAGSLYGMSVDGTLYRMSVDAAGISITDSTKLGIGFVGEMKLDDGRMYTTSGYVFDPVTRRILGRFPMEGTSSSFGQSTIALDPVASRTFILTDLVGGAIAKPLLAFDQRTFTLAARFNIPGILISPTATSPNVSRLIRWGDDGMAFRTNGDQVFVFRAPSLMAPFSPACINTGGLVNGASFASKTSLVPGSLVSLFGGGLASSSVIAGTIPLPTTLAGVSVQVNGIAAPLIFVSPNQINFQIPWELAGQAQVSIAIVRDNVTKATQRFSLDLSGPGIFALGSPDGGQGAVLLALTGEIAAPSGSIPGRSARPAHRGEAVSIFCTGLGTVTNQPASGAPASVDTLSTTFLAPTVTIGGVRATVKFSGLAPGFVGLYQTNVSVPDSAPMGSAVPVAINISGVDSNIVTMAVE